MRPQNEQNHRYAYSTHYFTQNLTSFRPFLKYHHNITQQSPIVQCCTHYLMLYNPHSRITQRTCLFIFPILELSLHHSFSISICITLAFPLSLHRIYSISICSCATSSHSLISFPYPAHSHLLRLSSLVSSFRSFTHFVSSFISPYTLRQCGCLG